MIKMAIAFTCATVALLRATGMLAASLSAAAASATQSIRSGVLKAMFDGGTLQAPRQAGRARRSALPQQSCDGGGDSSGQHPSGYDQPPGEPPRSAVETQRPTKRAFPAHTRPWTRVRPHCPKSLAPQRRQAVGPDLNPTQADQASERSGRQSQLALSATGSRRERRRPALGPSARRPPESRHGAGSQRSVVRRR